MFPPSVISAHAVPRYGKLGDLTRIRGELRLPSIEEQYTGEMYEQRGYFATWEPHVPIKIGHCGPIDGRTFKPQGHLSQWRIDFDVEDEGQPADIDYSSKSGLKTTFQLRGGAQTIPNIPQGTAGLRLLFEREEAVAMALKGARHSRIRDVQRLKRSLLAAVTSRNPFPDDWFVVTDLMASEFASVVIVQGKGASFAVTADADFAAGLVDLANASLKITIADENQVGYKMLAKSGATPLFRGIRLKRTWLRKIKFEEADVGSRSDQQIDEMFEPASPYTLEQHAAA
jgi:hypothetical protein